MDYYRTDVQTPRGAPATVLCRQGTSDLSLAGSSFRLWNNIDDEYRLAELHVDGAFLDIGAHAGYVTLAVLLDNPGATAICLEPIPENCDLLRANMERNGVADRVTVIQGAVGKGATVSVAYDYTSDPTNAYVGALLSASSTHTKTAEVPSYSVDDLLRLAGGSADAAKFDCEGCEYGGLAKGTPVGSIRVIFGEWHGHTAPNRAGLATIERLLRRTHDVESLSDLGGTGVFRAVRR